MAHQNSASVKEHSTSPVTTTVSTTATSVPAGPDQMRPVALRKGIPMSMKRVQESAPEVASQPDAKPSGHQNSASVDPAPPVATTVFTAATSESPATAPATLDTYTPLGTYSLNYDSTEWDDNRETPTTPVPFLDVCMTVVDSSRTHVLRIPELDKLADSLAARYQAKNGNLPTIKQYYTSWADPDANGDINVYIKLTSPELIAAAADGYNPAAPKYYDITITLDDYSQVNFPFIFISMRILISANDKRHWSPLQEMETAHLAPAPLVLKLASSAKGKIPKDIQAGANTLARLWVGFDAAKFQATSHDLLQQTMIFHISDTQRQNWARKVKPIEGTDPQSLPVELRSLLNPALIKWLQDKYIPAWICQRIGTLYNN
ncbi:uncharacterized protein CDV56_102833 [Aspergillus thermomutatus]|uniref:Uncharacterized protein n=1 Tax=Aspergillus thermomutatus TaxID=41047 RepID=A0A397G854_ASPTH|nr:uncharacterized protein CDV56_102833 [Aspergillus thermomutatus]RHZ44270.1 hypothetical protein CDV56_102833 [Aspergillus thermomutatus]